jgi:hypothetical protein
MPNDFITNLLWELHVWNDETQTLTAPILQEMIILAAEKTLGQQTLSHITLRHEIEVTDGPLELLTILELEEDQFVLWPADVATLRALLAFWNENRDIEVGMPLSMPVKLADGRIVSEMVQALMEDSDDEK